METSISNNQKYTIEDKTTPVLTFVLGWEHPEKKAWGKGPRANAPYVGFF